jgi:hypothetical protein
MLFDLGCHLFRRAGTNGMAQRQAEGRDLRGSPSPLSRSIPSGGAGRPSAGAGVNRRLSDGLVYRKHLPLCSVTLECLDHTAPQSLDGLYS